jgi:DNA repair protein RecN (Recombination protein N)
VEKTYDGQGRPISAMRRLEGEERVLEVARMLSGSRITEAAIENAKVLLGE